jgi:pre-mRNA-processing factor 8
MYLFRLYDDWLKSGSNYTAISSFTAFFRLNLLMRAMNVNAERTKIILRPTKDIITQSVHLWPTLTDEQWRDVEDQLKDVIFNDYGRKNNVNVGSLTDSEMRDIILGVEIAPPSQQRQEMAEIEKQAKEQSHLTAVTTKSHNIYGDQMVITTTSPYEQTAHISKTDWRIRALSTANLHLRTNWIYVNNEDTHSSSATSLSLGESDTNYTYVMPKNLLKKFITISDLRTQIGGFLYGITPVDNIYVREIRAIILPPQLGTHESVVFATTEVTHKALINMEPLGWIHTQGQELNGLACNDCVTHTQLVQERSTWDGNRCITMTVSFTPGSVTISAYKLTEQGFEWGKNNKVKDPTAGGGMMDSKGYTASMYERVQVVLSDRFLGLFLVPTERSWNYNMMGIKHRVDMAYALKVGVPLEFYNEVHRPTHFIKFSDESATLLKAPPTDGQRNTDKIAVLQVQANSGGIDNEENFFE